MSEAVPAKIQTYNCANCGYAIESWGGDYQQGGYIHKRSRSTRCCNERVYHINCECHPIGVERATPEKAEPLPVARALGSPFRRLLEWLT